MATVHDIAAYTLRRMGPVGAMKLQKLVYYAQAWSLVRRQAPLFHEPIEAWAYGPVVYELYTQHRGQFVVRAAQRGSADALSADEQRVVDDVLSYYGQYGDSQLSQMTHEEAPWRHARGAIPAGRPGDSTITLESMRQYYGGRRAPWDMAG